MSDKLLQLGVLQLYNLESLQSFILTLVAMQNKKQSGELWGVSIFQTSQLLPAPLSTSEKRENIRCDVPGTQKVKVDKDWSQLYFIIGLCCKNV